MFNLNDWYWFVEGNEKKVYSSKLQSFVDLNDKTYQSWIDFGNVPSKIDNVNHILSQLAKPLLDASDITVIRCYSAGISVPDEWKTYRNSLRSILNGTDLVSTKLPITPDYPAGS